MNNKKWYDNEISQGIMKKKYFHDGETCFNDIATRISNIYSDDIKKEVYNALNKCDILPAGRTIAGAGLKGKKNVSLSNCYICESPQDNLESISKVDLDMSIIGSRGGGIGCSLDNIRPKGTIINNSAKYSDGVEFVLSKYNSTGESIGQNNRHMAMMMALSCTHPDIYEILNIFIKNEKLSAMNISIKFTDNFMQSVIDNKEVELYFKVESTGEEIRKTINAKEFFNKFCEVNKDFGQPGLIFIDRVQRNNLLSGYSEYQIEVSNPCAEFFGNSGNSCLTGDTIIRTIDGVRQLKELVGTSGMVYSTNDKYEKYDNVISKGTKEVYAVKLHNGLTVKATKDHKFLTTLGWKECKNLVVGKDSIVVNKVYNVFAVNDYDERYEMFGWMHGDGWYGTTTVGISFNYGDGDKDVKERLLPLFKEEFKCSTNSPLKDDDASYQLQCATQYAMQHCKDIGFVQQRACNKELPTSFYGWTLKQQISFIRGLMTADGFITGTTNAQVAFCSTSSKLIHQIQNFFYAIGLQSRLMATVFREELNRKPQYKLILAGKSAKNYHRIFGFSGSKKEDKFKPGIVDTRKDSFIIDSIEVCGNEEVFDILNVNDTNAFYANGMAVHNCNLQSINLYNLVKNKFTKDAKIDYDLLVKNVKLSIDMLNQTLDYGYDMQPLDMNRKCIDDWRSIGLGVFGLADMFVALGVGYGSKESVDLVADLFERINYTALEESCNLARINKPFGKYDWNKTKESGMIKELEFTNETLYNKIMKDGLRNGTLISVAPTGTLSLFAGGLAGGVEPLFKVSYERTTHSTEDKGIKFRVFAKSVKELLEYNNLPLTTSDEEIKKLFPFIIESQELNPTDRIRVQSIMQQYVDNAISSTINLPKGTTTEEISDIYLDSWKQGLKGITVFVDECKRANILGVTDKKDNEIVFDSIVPEKRRKIKKVNGNTYKKETSCVPSMYVTVNRNDAGDIFEVFTATSSGCKSNIGTITRLVSYALRSGSSVKGIINELKENKCEACQLLRRKGNKEISSSCGNAIAEALEEEYNNGKEVKEVSTDGLMKCPECGKYSLKLDGHCQTCQECSWSICN